MDPNQPNDGSQGMFPGGNNSPYAAAWNPYMYGYHGPPWAPPPQGFPQIPTNVPMMHPSTNSAQGFHPVDMGDASVQNDDPAISAPNDDAQGSTGKGRKKKAGTTRIKLANFNPDEDVILVRSFAEIGDDPITSNGQRRDRMWERIMERYNLQRGSYVERSLRSLQSRFEVIKIEVAKFSSVHADVVRENPSGMTDADKFQSESQFSNLSQTVASSKLLLSPCSKRPSCVLVLQCGLGAGGEGLGYGPHSPSYLPLPFRWWHAGNGSGGGGGSQVGAPSMKKYDTRPHT